MISGVTASTGAYSYRWIPSTERRENPMARLAAALGLPADELRARLDTGRSLNDVAAERGVAHEDLITAIKSGLTPETAATAHVDDIAERIAGKTHPDRDTSLPPLPGGPLGENAGLRDETKLAGLSRLLGMSAADVTAAATGPYRLIGLLESKGVRLDALRGVLTSGDLVDVVA
ncbi:hypothetical protein [Actinoplanes sp. CA-252034]|uniref:hypothetical protein n=1 Tax=Actinoplanes sp. CA-252034 TaxID=3239906 RepID=UPI003D95377D